jgi:predicted phosphate transport protein (TIGR00153 family)
MGEKQNSIKEEHDDTGYFRTPVTSIFRRSPFEGLLEHASKVHECIKYLSPAVEHYCNAEYDKMNVMVEKISELEHEADLIKGNIRAHLPTFVFLPIKRGDFLMLLREEDSILDYAEDVANLMAMRHTKVPKEIKNELLEHTKKVVETVEAFEKAVTNLKDLLKTSFGKREREETKKLIHHLHRKEWEADQVEAKLSKQIFNMEDLDPISVVHLLKIVDRMDQIANHAENAGDWLRAMLAK